MKRCIIVRIRHILIVFYKITRRLEAMTKARKVELLYCKAKGKDLKATPEEIKEISRYKVDYDEGSYATKANIGAYVTAIDKGSRRSFYDWCIDNGKGDRRRREGRAETIREDDKWEAVRCVFVGTIFWSVALYMLLGGSAIFLAAVISFILYKVRRDHVGITMIILPIVLACLFGYIK